ncbi:aspartic peptidase domain-containing protein [Podospora conica]|nr:aspartic peptidase domain-containing protein [Schizothecium conicum]
MMRSLALSTLVAAAQAAGTFQVLWTTDRSLNDPNDVFGPDGPWQALDVRVGSEDQKRPMWPSGAGTSMASTQLPGVTGSIADSSTVIRSNVSMANSDEWFSSVFVGDEPSGFGVIDTVRIAQRTNDQLSRVNTTLVAVDEWPVNFAQDSTYTARVGILGLGPPSDKTLGSLTAPAGILTDLKSRGEIGSLSFGLHIGSVPFNQRGSLVLGGHERNRALGPVGVFRYDVLETAPPMLLLDVLLGTVAGGSPFPGIQGRPESSIWRGVGDNLVAEEITKRMGGKPGSAVVMVNPAAPYIYLPLGACEAAAAHLPVTFSQKLNLFLWDTSSPAYARIINAPSYMAFVFGDRTATNITIKVPFHLLNLTLEAPLVDTPTPYFPCRPIDSSYGFWMLGRAFLQAAFFGVDYERNLTYLAQAPGPDMEQSVLVERPAGQDGLETNPIEEWESSWMKRWTVLTAEGAETESNQKEEGLRAEGLGAGAIAGVVVGVLAILGAICAGVWYWRKKKGDKGMMAVPDQEGPREKWARGHQGFAEADAREQPVEVPSTMMVHEMEVPRVMHGDRRVVD